MENQKLLLFQELKSRRMIMVKFIWKEADENSPIYKTGFIISSVKLYKSKVINKRKGDYK